MNRYTFKNGKQYAVISARSVEEAYKKLLKELKLHNLIGWELVAMTRKNKNDHK